MRPDMIGRFQFNNIESDSFNLVCKSIKRPLLPAVKTKRVEIAGLSGAYDFPASEYALRPITMRIAYLGTNYHELRTRARSIAAWLGVDGWSRLLIHDEPDRSYLAKVTDEVDLESLWESGTVDITFDCQPFAYALQDTVSVISTTTPQTHIFTNPGTRLINYKSPPGSKSRFVITGSWSGLSLALHGRSLQYPAASGTLVLNNIELEATLGGVNQFHLLTGDVGTFLEIRPGSNSLLLSGTGLNVNVAIEFLPMWL